MRFQFGEFILFAGVPEYEGAGDVLSKVVKKEVFFVEGLHSLLLPSGSPHSPDFHLP